MLKIIMKSKGLAAALLTLLIIPSTPSISAPPEGCTTVSITVSGGDWVPSASYQPCNTPAGTQETWYIPWRTGQIDYVEKMDVASNSPFIIGRTSESCSISWCKTFNPTGEEYKITCDGCISGLVDNCPGSDANTDKCESD